MKNTFLRASLIISLATILLRLLGFLREVTLAAIYGAGVVSDAFVIAMTVPSVMLALFNATINAVYVPQYTNVNGDRNRFTSNLVTLLFVFGFIFALVFTLFPKALVYLFASGIAPETFTLASKLLRIIVWSAIPMLLLGVFRGFLQIKKMFFTAMISEALVNLFVLASIIAGKWTGTVLLMGIGAVVGNVAAVSMLIFFSVRNGFSYHLGLELRDPHIQEMLKLMLPIMFSAAVLEINQIIDKNLASSLVTGTVSSLNYAAKISNIVTALIGASIGAALFPRMSELAAENDYTSLKENLIGNVKILIPILLPLTIGIAVMAKPVTRILLERGAFNPEDTARTAECLQMYAIGLLAVNLSQLVTRAFYAMRKVKWPAILSTIALAIGISLDFLLIKPLGHRGLALATSISGILSVIMLLTMLQKSIGVLGLRSHLKELGKTILASLIMGTLIWITMRFPPILDGTYVQCLIWTSLIAGSGVLLYGVLLVVLRAEIASSMINRLKKVPILWRSK